MATDYNDVPIMGRLYQLYFDHDNGITDQEAATLLRLKYRQQVARYRKRMPGVYAVVPGRYTCAPNANQIEQAQAVLRRAAHEANRRRP